MNSPLLRDTLKIFPVVFVTLCNTFLKQGLRRNQANHLRCLPYLRHRAGPRCPYRSRALYLRNSDLLLKGKRTRHCLSLYQALQSKSPIRELQDRPAILSRALKAPFRLGANPAFAFLPIFHEKFHGISGGAEEFLLLINVSQFLPLEDA